MKQILIPLSLAVLLSSCAQRYAMKGHQAYDRLAFDDAIEHYEKIKDSKKNSEVMIRLADSYHFKNQPSEAIEWYAAAIDEVGVENVDDEVLLNYAQALESTGSYELAADYYEKFFKENVDDYAAFTRMVSSERNDAPLFGNDRIEIKKLAVNQPQRSSMSPVYHKDGVVFTSERNRTLKNKVSPWSGRPFVEMYYSELKDDGEFDFPTVFAKELQTPYDDGVVSFSPDGNTMYFTRTNYLDGELSTDDANIVNLKILKSELKDGEWQEPVELAFNSDDYSCVHPAVSPDGKRLYFASDMPGGKGESDIYVANIWEDGTIGLPRNLGYMVNTERDDMFPTISSENGHDVLYFSSEGHVGFGGLDIFKSRSYGYAWTTPEALPVPFNSKKDDFGLIFKGDVDKGYFTSNRSNDKGVDAIYNFERIRDGYLKVVALEAKTSEKLDDVKVSLVADTVEEKTLVTGSEGTAVFELEPNKTYTIQAERVGYLTEMESKITGHDLEGDTVLAHVVLAAVPGAEVSLEAPIFQPVYFDYDKFDIRTEEAKDLDRLANYMMSNPAVRVRLEGHTDSRGKDHYNDWLSHKRTEATLDYLIRKGIDRSRFVAKAYGEDQLVNDCDEKADDCSEEQHQRNRRTEIEIINETQMSLTDDSKK